MRVKERNIVLSLALLWTLCLTAGCVYSTSENRSLKSNSKDDSAVPPSAPSSSGKTPSSGKTSSAGAVPAQEGAPPQGNPACPSAPSREDLVPAVASPIPQNPVTRQTYIDYITSQVYAVNYKDTYAQVLLKAGKGDYCENWGEYGVITSMVALALYDAAKDKESVKDYLNYAKDCLQVFKKKMEETNAANEKQYGMAGHPYFMFQPEAIELVVRTLKEKGFLTPEDDKWIREMILTLNRTIYVWSTNWSLPGADKVPEWKYSFWRGPHHRAQGEGLMKRLAAWRYPDAKEAAEWKQYADTVWEDWWHYGEIGINDTNYFFNSFTRIAFVAWMLDIKDVFTSDRTKNLRERLLSQVTGDGAFLPFGPHEGWTQGVPDMIFLMELFATETGDGRFKEAAHRLMNYLLYQKDITPYTNVHEMAMRMLALAYFVADDSVLPVAPDPASKLSSWKESLLITTEGKNDAEIAKSKEAANYFLPIPVDKDFPKKGFIDVSDVLTDRTVPAKMFLESGHRPGDFTALVDVSPRFPPVNPGGILGMMSHGSLLAMADSSKLYSTRQNMLSIIDRTNNPKLCTIELAFFSIKCPDELHLVPNTSLYHHPWGVPYLVETQVDPFKDYSLATYAKVTTDNYLGFPVTNRRDFFFVKNRFLVLRDVANFSQGFEARLDPVWYTQKWDEKGDNWVNTHIENPPYLRDVGVWGDNTKMNNPRWDLLVYHAPHPERQLDITEDKSDHGIDWIVHYKTKRFMPFAVHYFRDGFVKAGEPMSFAQILIPHDPKESASAIVAGITVLADTPRLTVLRVVAGSAGREEWVVLNANGDAVEVPGLSTDGKQVYLDVQDGKILRILAVEASRLALDGKEIFNKTERTTIDGVLPSPECL